MQLICVVRAVNCYNGFLHRLVLLPHARMRETGLSNRFCPSVLQCVTVSLGSGKSRNDGNGYGNGNGNGNGNANASVQ